MRRCPCARRCSTARLAPPDVVEQDAVGSQLPRRAVDEDDGNAHVDLLGQEAVIAPGRHHQQSVHAPLDQRVDDLPLANAVLVGAGRDEHQAAIAGHLLDGAGDGREEGVGHVLDDQADGLAAAAALEAAGDLVAPETELADGVADTGGRRGSNAGLAVDHPRDRLEADSGNGGHMTKRGTGNPTLIRFRDGSRGALVQRGQASSPGDHRQMAPLHGSDNDRRPERVRERRLRDAPFATGERSRLGARVASGRGRQLLAGLALVDVAAFLRWS